MKDLAKLLSECELLARAGRDQAVGKIVSALNYSKVPREFRLPLANICRRTSQIKTGLRLLTPIIRSSKKLDVPPSSAEKAEYAILLQRAGSVREALTVLDTVPVEELPAARLYRAFCHFNVWDYAGAAELLSDYLKTNLDAYSQLIGRVNLGAAKLAIGRWEEAEQLLLQSASEAKASGADRLYGNCQELLTQKYLLNDDVARAEKSIAAALGVFEQQRGLDRLLVGKCQAFLEAKRRGDVGPLLEFRIRAAAWPHAETVREIDLFSLLIEPDAKVLERLYFGTPFAGYRDRIGSLVGQVPVGESFIIGDHEAKRRLDIVSGRISGGPGLKAGGALHRVIGALSKDLYRAVPVNGLFATLFPDEYFSIFSSASRVHQILRRARRWLEENEIAAEIVTGPSGFRLEPGHGFAIEIPRDLPELDRDRAAFIKLEARHPEGFTAREAAETLSLSPSATQRLLDRGRHRGMISVFGASTATRYYIEKATKRAA